MSLVGFPPEISAGEPNKEVEERRRFFFGYRPFMLLVLGVEPSKAKSVIWNSGRGMYGPTMHRSS